MSFHLLLCMTPGIGLDSWLKNGSLEHELKPYKEYVRRGWTVSFASYDIVGRSIELPDGMTVYPVWNRPHFYWINLLHLVRFQKGVHVVKSNQAAGAWWYGLAARLARRPFVLRCGWVPGRQYAERGLRGPKVILNRMLEGYAFRQATASQVATQGDKDFICKSYGIPKDRVHVRPNWINIDLFRPRSETPQQGTVVFAGRLAPIKRLDLLIRACHLAGAKHLMLVGGGPEQKRLADLAKGLGLRLELPGIRPQRDLPALLHSNMVFALTSQVEGHPKALFEAMACGIPCIGVNAPGIRDAIIHETTGLIVQATAEAVAEGLTRLFGDADLRQHLAIEGRAFVQEHLDFHRVIEAEIRLVTNLVEKHSSCIHDRNTTAR